MMKNNKVNRKIINDINPTLKKNSRKDIFAYVVINMLGIDEIENIVPPIFTKTA